MNAPAQRPAGGRLYILLPVHNRRETTVRFATALTAQTRREFQLVLIDDGSTDGTADAVRALCPAVEVVRGDGRWWWAGSLHEGCRHLSRRGVHDDDLVLFINDDVVIGPRFLEELTAEFAGLPDTLLLARQTDARTGAEIDHGGGVRVDLDELRFAAARSPEEINCLPTRGLLLRWRDLRRTGGFHPRSLPHYLSDYEFTLRAQRHGLRLRVARTARVGVAMEQSGRSLGNLLAEPRSRRLALMFSRRFKDNPVTWSVFAWLAAPRVRVSYLWLKIWTHFLINAARCLVLPGPRGTGR
ncbi:MAG: glycosyltransferase family 2 protein [Verrucomicrobiota bacterium]